MKHLIAFIFSIFAIAALIDPVGRRHSEDRATFWILQAAILMVAAIWLAFYLRTYYEHDIKSSRSPRNIQEIDQVPEAEAYSLQKLASRIQLNAVQARIFALAILAPAEMRQRVVERYTPNERTLHQEVTIEAQIPAQLLPTNINTVQSYESMSGGEIASPVLGFPPEGAREEFNYSSWTGPQLGPLSRVLFHQFMTQSAPRPTSHQGASALFPLLVIPKGCFNDNLEVSDIDGNEIPLLTYREYLQVTAAMLRLLLTLAYGIPSSNAPHFPRGRSGAADSEVLHLEHRALCEIVKRDRAATKMKDTQGVSPVAPKADEVAERLEKLPIADPSRRVYLILAAALVRKLSRHYALVASTELPPDGRLILRYARTLIPELESSEAGGENGQTYLKKAYKRFKGWLRILFGTRPVNVTVSLDNAWTTYSYHVRVDAPDGLYLARQELIASPKYLEQMAENAPTPPHYRFRRRLGQSYAHFYCRFFPLPISGERRPKIQLDFNEVPPGSSFRAAIASSASFGLIWLVGFVLSRNGNPGTDAPAFLLVFPGVAATWLGFDTTTHRLFDGTLSARLSLALTTLVSVAASGAFILSQSGLRLFNSAMPDGSSVLGVYRWPWAILITIAFLNSSYMGCSWLQRSWKFKYLAERRDPGQEF
jgi:hypothetical protein